ncbi:hypothetical protein HYU91_02235 [Candidatus Collierbacteria bacterium]|nr:hypothetical protein [Candidatus Collierbacteria bacterium]
MASKKSFLSRLSSKQKLSLFFFAVLLLAFPLIVLAVKFQQDFRSRAYTPSPIITTSSLPSATQGTKYEATVLGIDSSGYGNFLSMNFSGLPAGLSKGPCQISAPAADKIRPSVTPIPPISVSPTKKTPAAPPCVPQPPCPADSSNCQVPPPPSGKSYCPRPTPTPITPTQISCLITGVPTTPGTFKVIVTLSNSQTKLSATQGLGLSVTPSPTTCIMCPPPPVNCTYVGGSCSSCGTLSCQVTRTPTPTTRFYTPTPIIYRPN